MDLLSEMLQSFSPSQADVEVRTLSPEAGGSDILMLSFMEMLVAVLKTGRHYELIQAYISLFIKVRILFIFYKIISIV